MFWIERKFKSGWYSLNMNSSSLVVNGLEDLGSRGFACLFLFICPSFQVREKNNNQRQSCLPSSLRAHRLLGFYALSSPPTCSSNKQKPSSTSTPKIRSHSFDPISTTLFSRPCINWYPHSYIVLIKHHAPSHRRARRSCCFCSRRCCRSSWSSGLLPQVSHSPQSRIIYGSWPSSVQLQLRSM